MQSKRKNYVLRELYYITHVKNVESILKEGILSHKRIVDEGLVFERIYNPEVVCRREGITVPDGRSLWDFANLYFQARNPMLFTVIRNNPLATIAVIGVDRSVLDRNDVYITTGNAAHSQTEILPASERKRILPDILNNINRIYWNEVDGSKRTIMAECLVPDSIPPTYIRSIYFADYTSKKQAEQTLSKPAHIDFLYQPNLFFQPTRSRQITPLLSVLDGDMFFSLAQTLTVSVNIGGIMGKGVASRAKYQFPDVYVHYQDLCRRNQLKMGTPVLYKRELSFDYEFADEPLTIKELNGETWFLLFPTKKHWSDNSDIRDVEAGLKWIVENYKKEGIKSLALPALGCGLGGLSWSQVGPLMCQYLAQLDIRVYIYLPEEHEIPDEQITPEFLLGQKHL